MAENDVLKRLLDAGMTFTSLTQARAEELIRELVRAGALQAEQAQAGVDELVDRSRRNSERLIDAVRTEIDQQLGKLDLATRSDIETMVQRFADLAESVVGYAASRRGGTGWGPAREDAAAPAIPAVEADAPASSPAASARKAAPKKAAPKKATAKKAAPKQAAPADPQA
jgi:polyhydroxyalkanoate synthesis regulator phasin